MIGAALSPVVHTGRGNDEDQISGEWPDDTLALLLF